MLLKMLSILAKIGLISMSELVKVLVKLLNGIMNQSSILVKILANLLSTLLNQL